MEMMARIPCLALYLLYFLPVEQALITKTENGYSGIIVAFHKSIPENTKLLLRALELFKDSSALLYNTTQGRAFFGNITIVVPMSWNSTSVKRTISGLSDVSYEESYGDYFREADIIIDPHKNPNHEDGPYTLQIGDCFEPGQYIHLTPEFVIDEFQNISYSYGPRDRNIVHEWMHLRYGIFDEYGIKGDQDFPLLYLEDREVKVSACDRNIKGFIQTKSGEKCPVYNQNQISEDCNFYPDKKTTSKASIMSITYLDSIREFCDNDTEANDGNRHNSKAPTKQNRFCNGLSVLEVLDRHPDFENSRKWEVPYVPPNFRVSQPVSLDPRFVLVLDVSISMENTINILTTAGKIFVEDLLPEGSYIGIVKYSNTAQTVQDLVKIDSRNRKNVSQKFPNNASGMTAIGQGLNEAIQVLNRRKQPTEGATIVLMTDGDENVHPFIKEVLPTLVQKKVKVHTLAFGTKASESLEEVAVATNGKAYFFEPGVGIPTADLKNIFADIITIQADDDLQSEQIFREQFNLTDYHQNVRIDEELGNNTLFMVTVSGKVESVNLELISPAGTIYNQSREEYKKDANKNLIHFRIPAAESGIWNISMKSSGTSAVKVELLVTSAPKNIDEQPVRVSAWLSSIKIQHPDVPRLFARVTKGMDIIIHAEVQAMVISPNGTKIIILRDNGSGADKLRNDGIYSAYFIPTKDGRYSVFTRVLNSGSALIKKARTFSRSQRVPKENVKGRLNVEPASSFDLSYFVQANEPEPLAEGAIVEEFTRITDAGSFIVEKMNSSQDKIPPNPVNDLRVLSIDITDEGEMIATLQWTSPGDNMDEGNAKYLDIRTSKSHQSLRREHFEAALRINESHGYFNNTLNPAPGRTLQKLTIFLPIELELDTESAFDLYFALRAADEAGNWGSASNVAVGHYGYIIPEPKVTTTVWTTNETMTESMAKDTVTESLSTETVYTKNSANQSGSLDVAIGVSVGVICLSIFGVIGWLVWRRRKRLVQA